MGCAMQGNLFRTVRPHAKHVKEVNATPSDCIDLGTIKMLDFPEYDDEEYNFDAFTKFFTNKTGKVGGDTFQVLKRWKTMEASEGYDKEPYLNGIAQAYRCHNKDKFVMDPRLKVNLIYDEPLGCKYVGKASEHDMYIHYVEMKVREAAVDDNANTAYMHEVNKLYKVGDRSFFSHYEVEAKLYNCPVMSSPKTPAKIRVRSGTGKA